MSHHKVEFKGLKELSHRLEVFAGHHNFITEHNAKYDQGLETFTVAHNKWSTHTMEEYRAEHGGLRPDEAKKPIPAPALSQSRRRRLAEDEDEKEVASSATLASLPESISWLEKGFVTPAKSQGKMCGGCWAYASVAAMESHLAAATGELVDLSIEEVLDCDGYNDGCMGGTLGGSFSWMYDRGGVCADRDYSKGLFQFLTYCRGNCSPYPETDLAGFVEVDTDEPSVKAALNFGPAAAAIDMESEAMMLYSGGIIQSPCTSYVSHAVLLVGYGEEDGIPYWIIKNSWGTGWGEDGFFRLKRDVHNPDGNCGIRTDVRYPVLNASAELWDAMMDQLDPAVNAELEALGLQKQDDGVMEEDSSDFPTLPKYHDADGKAVDWDDIDWSQPNADAAPFEAKLKLSAAYDCGAESGMKVHFPNPTMTPSPPVRGELMTIAATGDVLKGQVETLLGGEYTLTLSYAGMDLYTHSGALCTTDTFELPLGLGEVKVPNFACTNEEGVDFSVNLVMPEIAPPGDYLMNIQAVDNQGKDALCLAIEFEA
ncbi:unnamed protein product [Chrysoparadoxa australica]